MDLVGKLNSLLEKNHDALNGYAQAADRVENKRLAELFKEHSAQRNQFAQDLREQINLFDGETKDGGSVAAMMHRAWIDLKSAFTSGDERAIISECIRGEKASLEEYDEILEHKGEMSEFAYATIAKQKAVIMNYVNELEMMEEVYD